MNPESVESQNETVKVFTEVNYIPGQENKAAFLPILENLPMKHAFTFGSKAGNMSPVYAGEEATVVVRERIRSFLEDNGMDTENVANTTGAFDGTHLQMQELVLEDLTEHPETKIKANFVFTRDPRITLSIRPGDCNVSILYAKDRMGRDIVGLIHSSAQSANAGLPRYAIQHLLNEEDVDVSTIRIGITPGISKKHYAISQDEQLITKKNPDGEETKEIVSRPEIVVKNWKEHIDPPLTDDPSEQRPVDILGATIMQFVEEGIKPDQIQAYDIDTWEAAAKGESYSNRYAAQLKRPQGRYMIAVQLKS